MFVENIIPVFAILVDELNVNPAKLSTGTGAAKNGANNRFTSGAIDQ